MRLDFTVFSLPCMVLGVLRRNIIRSLHAARLEIKVLILGTAFMRNWNILSINFVITE